MHLQPYFEKGESAYIVNTLTGGLWKKTLCIGIPLFLGGFAISSIGFMQNVLASAKGIFPVEGPVSLAALWEIPWHNDSIGVVMMTTAWILFFKKCNASGMFYQKILSPVSKASYGMYLCHMFVLVAVTSWVRTSLGIGEVLDYPCPNPPHHHFVIHHRRHHQYPSAKNTEDW